MVAPHYGRERERERERAPHYGREREREREPPTTVGTAPNDPCVLGALLVVLGKIVTERLFWQCP